MVWKAAHGQLVRSAILCIPRTVKRLDAISAIIPNLQTDVPPYKYYSKSHKRASCTSTPVVVCKGSSSTAPLVQQSPEQDEHYMRLALEQAQLASDADEVPVGAVLVSSTGEVLASARNSTESDCDPTAHAELECIRHASRRQGGWRLLDATLYVTLEPCPMCAGAILQSRIGSVVYGARNTLLGADGSWISMLQAGRCEHQADDRDLEGRKQQKPHPFHPNLAVREGVLAAECSALIKDFFVRRREGAAGVRLES